MEKPTRTAIIRTQDASFRTQTGVRAKHKTLTRMLFKLAMLLSIQGSRFGGTRICRQSRDLRTRLLSATTPWPILQRRGPSSVPPSSFMGPSRATAGRLRSIVGLRCTLNYKHGKRELTTNRQTNHPFHHFF